MNLAIFDIDGTLTNTNRVDGQCSLNAFKKTFDIQITNFDWNDYPHVTDMGVANHIFQEKYGRDLTATEVANVTNALMKEFEKSWKETPELFREVPGAKAAFQSVLEKEGWCVGIATGCFERSAKFKLSKVDININGVPAGFAEDGISREEIVNASIQRAKEKYEIAGFEKIVSVGDGLWDLKTANNLGLHFIGIDIKNRGHLTKAGSRFVLQDFSDQQLFYQHLITC